MGKRKSAAECCEPKPFEEQREERQERRNLKELRASLALAHLQIDDLLREKELLLGLADRKNAKAWDRPAKIARGRATAVFVVSDLHIGEVVRKEAVLGLNEFNHRVAEQRIKQAFSRFTPLVEKERTLATIEEAVVLVIGDLIGGKIHSDQAEVNDLGLASSAELAEEVLEAGLRTILKEAGLKKITVLCLSGNHDRLSPRVQHSSFYQNSIASNVYQHLRKRFAGDARMQFHIGQGEYLDLPVYGWNIRATHGHRIKFSGGIGGLSIPWTKHVMRLNRSKHADFTIGAHLHVWSHSAETGFLVNGSVIGTTEYSLPFGHQEPCQGFLVVDKKRCVTVAQKVYCD